ncbi:hypothetical protein Tco_0265187 [Tanacetum coccineum]
MHEDFEYVESLEKEIDELESEKADFSNIYDLLLEEFKECECLAQKLSKLTESVNEEVHNNLLKSFSKLEKHSISLELALQHCKEQMKNNSVCKENASNVFRKEHEQYHEIQDLKAQMQDKNIAISELKKLIEKCKGKYSVLINHTFRPRSSMLVMTSVHISSGLVLHQMTSDHNRSELGIHDHRNEPSSSKLVPKVVPLAVKTATSYSNAEDNSNSGLQIKEGLKPVSQQREN